MNRAHSFLTAILFLACLGLGYLVLHQRTELTEVNLRSGTAEKEAEKRLGDLQHDLAAAKAALALADRQAALVAGGSSAAAPARSGETSGGAKIIHISDILKDHPEYTALYAKQMRRNVDRIYGSTLATLNLPPDQLSQLKNALAERQMSNVDAEAAAEAAGVERGSPEWQAAMKQASQEVEQQITAVLGANADNTLLQLQTRNAIQNSIDTNYGPDFADAGAALSPDQSHGLLQAMADANYSGKDMSTRPQNYNDVDPATGLSLHDNRIIDAAAQVLSPAQVQVLKTDQAETEKFSTIMKEYNPGNRQVMFVP